MRQIEEKTGALGLKPGWAKKISRSNYAVLVLITAVMLGLGTIINPQFLSVTNIGSILTMASLLGFVAVGQTLVIISGGEGIDLSVASVMSFGAVLAAWFMGGKNGNILLALIIVLAMGALVGWLNSFGIIHGKIPPLVMTLAMISVLTSVQQIFTGGFPKGSPAPLTRAIATGRPLSFLPWLVVLWVAEMALVFFLLRRTSFGRQLYATGNNPNAAFLSGVKVNKIRSLAYVLCGVFSALAGFWLCAYNGVIYVDSASSYMMPAIAAVVIGGTSLAGGKGTYFGTVVGAIILTVLTSLLVMLNTDDAIRMIINGVLLMVLLAVYTRQPPIRQ